VQGQYISIWREWMDELEAAEPLEEFRAGMTQQQLPAKSAQKTAAQLKRLQANTIKFHDLRQIQDYVAPRGPGDKLQQIV
jgi:hypothetical protein